MKPIRWLTLLLIALPLTIVAQIPGQLSKESAGRKANTGSDPLPIEQRTFVISQLMSLAQEARSYRDLALRSHVLTRVADSLWETDAETAGRIFHQAWEAAEVADKEEVKNPPPLKTTNLSPASINDTQVQLLASLRRASGWDARNEVLRTAARRDRGLGEEFLIKLKEQAERDSSSTNQAHGQSSDTLARRLQLARNLLDDDQVDQAIAFATPALLEVNRNSIGFLSALRPKRPDLADQRFSFLLARAEIDPAADANTVSGLSSYVFSPGYYITYNADFGASWSFLEAPSAPPDLPPAIRNAFFTVAASILLRPLPPPAQDHSTSGQQGKVMVIQRLLPLFDKYVPDSATALRTQLVSLQSESSRGAMADQQRMKESLTQGLNPPEPAGDVLTRMQDRLDRSKTSQERDFIYRDAAIDLGDRGDARARDIADKIDNSELRVRVLRYVDFRLVEFALKRKDATEAVRLAKVGQLTQLQRAWSYLRAASLLLESQRQRSLDLLEEAGSEARRISADDPDRARSLFALAAQFVVADRERAWETIDEAVKAANSAEGFTGEDTSVRNPPVTLKLGARFEQLKDEDFGISNVLRSLAKLDLDRCMDVVKSFKKDGPRAVAVLAIARGILEKSPAPNPER